MRLTEEQELNYIREYGIDNLGEYDLVLGLGIDLFERWSPEDLATAKALEVIKPVQVHSWISERLRNELYEGMKDGKKILYVSLPYAAARAASFWEPYFCHGPTRRAIGIGWCGELQGTIEIGSYIIPEQVTPGEGMTPYYFPKDKGLPPILREEFIAKPSEHVMRGLVDYYKHKGLSSIMGKVYTIETLKCESEEILDKLHRTGYVGIDMESSAFLASAKFHGKDAIVVLTVSDKPYARYHNYIFPRNEIPDYFYDRAKDVVKEATLFLASL